MPPPPFPRPGCSRAADTRPRWSLAPGQTPAADHRRNMDAHSVTTFDEQSTHHSHLSHLPRRASAGSAVASTAPSKIVPAKAARAAAGVVAASTLPPRRTAKRGQSSATSSTRWVENTTVRSSASSASSRWPRWRSSGSRPAVGSSTITRSGAPAIACVSAAATTRDDEPGPGGSCHQRCAGTIQK